LDQYVRIIGKIDLIDRYLAEYGVLRPDGEPQPAMRLYVALQNSARLSLVRLEDHLRKRGIEPSMVALLQGASRRAG
jgi:hypothetical protein